jgi:hypothetical protein
MSHVSRYLKFLLIVIVVCLLGYFFIAYYSFIFSRKVVGKIEKVEKVQLNVALMTSSGTAAQKLNNEMYSFAVAIRQADGEIVTSSATDRQWAVAQPGQCAVAIYYPFPPWQLYKTSTYYGAKLEKLYDCQASATSGN